MIIGEGWRKGDQHIR